MALGIHCQEARYFRQLGLWYRPPLLAAEELSEAGHRIRCVLIHPSLVTVLPALQISILVLKIVGLQLKLQGSATLSPDYLEEGKPPRNEVRLPHTLHTHCPAPRGFAG